MLGLGLRMGFLPESHGHKVGEDDLSKGKVGSVAHRKENGFHAGKRNKFHQEPSCDSHIVYTFDKLPSSQVTVHVS